jgi:hypothetical protein
MHTIFWLGYLKAGDQSEDLDVDGNITINIGEIGWEVVDWFHLAQDRDQWRALLNTVMNLPFP